MARTGRLTDGSNPPQVVDGAPEPVGLAQDRDRGGATGLVRPGASHEVVAGCRDTPADGDAALELRDQVETRGREPFGDRARSRRRLGGTPEGAGVAPSSSARTSARRRAAISATTFERAALGRVDAIRALRSPGRGRRHGHAGVPASAVDRRGRLGGAPFGPQPREQLGSQTGIDGQRRALDPLLHLPDDARHEQGGARR